MPAGALDVQALERRGEGSSRGPFSPLPRSFYERPVLAVARACIGKILVRNTGESLVAGRIVETEAYRGPEDRAAHSWGGRRTPRTEVMFGPAGFAYVFLVYGMHWHFNLVTGQPGEPQAVLVRAIEPVAGRAAMASRRAMAPDRLELTNGPGKLCAACAIDGECYGMDLCAGADLYLSDGPPPARVARTTRVGIDYAGEWADRPWRFYDPASRYVSTARSSRRPS